MANRSSATSLSGGTDDQKNCHKGSVLLHLSLNFFSVRWIVSAIDVSLSSSKLHRASLKAYPSQNMTTAMVFIMLMILSVVKDWFQIRVGVLKYKGELLELNRSFWYCILQIHKNTTHRDTIKRCSLASRCIYSQNQKCQRRHEWANWVAWVIMTRLDIKARCLLMIHWLYLGYT